LRRCCTMNPFIRHAIERRIFQTIETLVDETLARRIALLVADELLDDDDENARPTIEWGRVCVECQILAAPDDCEDEPCSACGGGRCPCGICDACSDEMNQADAEVPF
jgi:hypothetical protein